MVARPLSVVQMLPGLDSGGVERGTLEMAAFLTARGHRSIVVGLGGRLAAPLVAGGSRHYCWPVGAKDPRVLTTLWPLRRLLLRQRVDVLHLRSRMPAWAGYLAWRSLAPRRRPLLVTTFHGFYSVNAYSAIMARGQRVIAISRVIREHIRSCYGVPDERLAVIYRGVDPGIFDPARVDPACVAAVRRRWGVTPDGGPVLLLPGRMSRIKGHEPFLHSLARLHDLPWQAVCVGEPADNPAYVKGLKALRAQLGLEKRVRFPGFAEDMPAALLAADVVVSATVGRPEAFGRVAVEAQAMGRPVIATAHGGSLETVCEGRSGWLVPVGDTAAWAAALRSAAADPARCRRMGQWGRRRVLERFTVPRMCAQTMALYEAGLAGDDVRGSKCV